MFDMLLRIKILGEAHFAGPFNFLSRTSESKKEPAVISQDNSGVLPDFLINLMCAVGHAASGRG